MKNYTAEEKMSEERIINYLRIWSYVYLVISLIGGLILCAHSMAVIGIISIFFSAMTFILALTFSYMAENIMGTVENIVYLRDDIKKIIRILEELK